ncbi:MAG: hypothetical protein ACRDJL_02270 [Actinomycetota bacterium]
MRLKFVLLAALAALLCLPVSMAGAESSTLLEGALKSPDFGRAVELKEPVPDWYTAELHRKAVAAGKKGETVAVPEGVDLEIPASGLAFTGIRPGSWILFPAGCTANFVFGNGTEIGTAGHCADVGDEVTIVAAPGLLMNIGTVSLSRDNGIGDDFALIDIYPAMQQYVNPSMAHWAGPTGSANPQFGDAVVHSGHGLVIGTGGTPRAGVVTYTGPGDTNNNNNAYAWDGAASPGDSGSAVRNVTGAASGNLTHLVVGTEYLPAFIAGTTISRMEALAGPVTTASLIPDPLY